MKFTVETVKKKEPAGLKSADFIWLRYCLLLPQGCLLDTVRCQKAG